MPKKSSRGGARKGAGRKPASDPKIIIPIYVEESIINAIGSVEEVKNECYLFLKNKGITNVWISIFNWLWFDKNNLNIVNTM